jgi:Protein of unknown function (DUF3562)
MDFPASQSGEFTVTESAQLMRKHRGLDESTIGALARKTDTPIKVVRQLYKQEITELQSNSTVKTFISVITGRRVMQRLLSARNRESPRAYVDGAKPPIAPPRVRDSWREQRRS